MLESHIEKQMENAVETGILIGLKGPIAPVNIFWAYT